MVDKIVTFFIGGLVSELKQSPWTTLTAASALGLVIWGHTHHAAAEDMVEITSQLSIQLRDIRAAQIEDKIIAARTRSCHAHEQGQEDQRQYFERVVRDYKDQYRKIKGEIYIAPSCDEV